MEYQQMLNLLDNTQTYDNKLIAPIVKLNLRLQC